ncbi:hypothetical protein AVEN_67891-1 [Araneus ventricosus]|uniref:Uncharacterized protein n=1 Tax=Araneus ventricosus TaxID=182803 RepID=A0A4Y2KSZ6_ARAVE|nr:hypothetical protein AVEN_67891-1 [Araneus ventricosus]
MSGINVEEYLTADDDRMVLKELLKKIPISSVISEITHEMENDDDADISQSLLTLIRGGRRPSEGTGGHCPPPAGKNDCTPFTQRHIQLMDKKGSGGNLIPISLHSPPHVQQVVPPVG